MATPIWRSLTTAGSAQGRGLSRDGLGSSMPSSCLHPDFDTYATLLGQPPRASFLFYSSNAPDTHGLSTYADGCVFLVICLPPVCLAHQSWSEAVSSGRATVLFWLTVSHSTNLFQTENEHGREHNTCYRGEGHHHVTFKMRHRGEMETCAPRMKLNPYPTTDAKCKSECIRDPGGITQPTDALEDMGKGLEALNEAAISQLQYPKHGQQ